MDEEGLTSETEYTRSETVRLIEPPVSQLTRVTLRRITYATTRRRWPRPTSLKKQVTVHPCVVHYREEGGAS